MIKLTAWLLAIAVNTVGVSVYLNVKGLDGGFLSQIEKGDADIQDGKYEKALKHYLKASDIAPESPIGFINAAATYVSLGDMDSAIRLMEQYTAKSPRSTESYEYLLSLYEKAGVSLEKQVELLTAASLIFPDASFADRAGKLKLQLAESEGS